MAGDLPVEVSFVTAPEEANRFLGRLKGEGLNLFYLRVPVDYGFSDDAATRPRRPKNSLVFGLFLTLGQRQPDLLLQFGLEARLEAELARQLLQVGPLQKMLLIDH